MIAILGGLGAATAAQAVTTFVDRAVGSETWLKGPFGPPFFNVALFMGLLYGGIALGLARRRDAVLIGALGPFLGIAVPLALLTRASERLPWVGVVIAVFVLAVWGTIFGLGRALAGRWLGGLAACGGALAGYAVLQLVTWAVPSLAQYRPVSYWPSPVGLLDGILTAAGIAGGIAIIRRRHGDLARSRID